METLETLSEQLRTTGDIRSIVRTMKSLSAASIRQFERAEAAISDHAETIDLGLTALLLDRRARGLPPPRTSAGGTAESVVVIGSDRGLCGRYNDLVARRAQASLGPRTSVLAVVGARAAARLEAGGHAIDRLFHPPGTIAGMGPMLQDMLVEVERWTHERGVGTVRLVHNRRAGAVHARPTERILLPIPEAHFAGLLQSGWPGEGLPFFRADPDTLLSWLVRQHLFVVLYRALAEALASEHATRLAAMQRAERNIDERHLDLTAAYRRRRQETITRELLDVVAGSEAAGREDGEDA